MIKLLSLSTALLLVVLPRTDNPGTASLGGSVFDLSDAPIAGATLSARNKFSGEVEAATSDATGAYELRGLRPGRYSVLAQADGYGCVWSLNVFLYAGKHTRLDFKLTASGTRTWAADCSEDAGSTR